MTSFEDSSKMIISTENSKRKVSIEDSHKLMDSTANNHKKVSIEDSHKLMVSINFGTTGGGRPDDTKSKRIFIAEITALIVGIGVLWMVLLLPIIFYHLPDEVYGGKTRVQEGPTTTANSSTANPCASAIPYPTEGGVCQEALMESLLASHCHTEDSTPLVLSDGEATAMQLIGFLSNLPECAPVGVPLLCMYLFGLCSSSGVFLQPTSGQCKSARDDLCSDIWMLALQLKADLPDCDNFPEEQVSCPENERENITFSGDVETLIVNSTSTTDLLPCREDFFRPEGLSFCVASCHTWSQFSKTATVVIDVFVGSAAIIGLVTGVVVLVVSVLRYKKIFVFPSMFIVYMDCDFLIIAFFVLITYFDRPSLYCSAEDLPTSEAEPTPFCVITGITFMYIMFQMAMWWLFHTSALLWKVGFPMHSRSFDKSGKTKYIHIACIIVGVLLPLTPPIAIMASYAEEVGSTGDFVTGGLGFSFSQLPPLLCAGTHSGKVAYYSTILPINLIFFVGMTELVLVFAIVHKQHGIFVEKKSIASHFKIGTPERKLLIALCYYVLLMIFALPAFTINTRVGRLLGDNLVDYFACEAAGVDPENSTRCDNLIEEFRKYSYPEMQTLAIVLMELFPIVFVIYTVNFEELKGKWLKRRHRRRTSESQSISEMRSTRMSTL